MTTPTATPKPMPSPDAESRPYFDAGGRGVLLLKKCGDCAAWLPPDAAFCSQCLGESLAWAEASGLGKLFTFGIVHQKLPGFENDVPYNVSVVQLAEGVRMTTNVLGCPNDQLRVGMALQVVFNDAGNGTPMPRFRPV